MGIALFSCSKEVEDGVDSYTINTVTESVAASKCWDRNKNGEPDKNEDTNKDGQVNSDDCIKK